MKSLINCEALLPQRSKSLRYPLFVTGLAKTGAHLAVSDTYICDNYYDHNTSWLRAYYKL
jgi:hypothetical protein